MSLEDELHASRQGPDSLFSASYWRRVCPGLSVEDDAFQAGIKGRREDVASSSDCAEVRARLLEEGFAALRPSSVRWSVDVAALVEGVTALQRHGWPASFITVFDETWAMALDAGEIVSRSTGNVFSMDIVAFHVDPRRAKGFSPHRDRQPADWVPRGVPAAVSSTFRADGMAKYVTLWAALTDAHPDNSCLHFVPKACDPGYFEGDPQDADPMQLCFPDKDAFRNIRCAAVDAGGCSLHTHRVIHWGSRGRPSHRGGPRVALSFPFSDPDFEPPCFGSRHLPFPPLGLRVSLVSAQILNYATTRAGDREGWSAIAGPMADCTSGTFGLLHRLFQRHSKAFHSTYRKEIARKFVAVSLDANRSSATDGGPAVGSDVTCGDVAADDVATARVAGVRGARGCGGGDDDSDDDDEALAAMLEAENVAGEVLFHDDFDVLDGGAEDVVASGLARAGVVPRGKKRRRGKRRTAVHSTVTQRLPGVRRRCR